MNLDLSDELDEFQHDFEDLGTKKNASYSNDSLQGSTNVDSEDEYESHFDAIDELSKIFSSSDVSEQSIKQVENVPFQRPSNPVWYDLQFSMPRCTAPWPFGNQVIPEGEKRMPKFSFECSARSQGSINSNENYLRVGRSATTKAELFNSVLLDRPSSFPTLVCGDDKASY